MLKLTWFIMLCDIIVGKIKPLCSMELGLVVLAGHNSGSTFLSRYFKEVAASINSTIYSENLTPNLAYLDVLRNFKADKTPFKIIAPYRHFNYTELNLGNSKFLFMFHYRNILDVLISRYYSFGWTHMPPSKSDKEGWDTFWNDRYMIRNMTLDKYVLLKLPDELINIRAFFEFKKSIKCGFISKYEDMIQNFEKWHNKIMFYVPIKKNKEKIIKSLFMKEMISVRSKTPVDVINLNITKEDLFNATKAEARHIRDPSVGQYRNN